jgi:hypothetical protein
MKAKYSTQHRCEFPIPLRVEYSDEDLVLEHRTLQYVGVCFQYLSENIEVPQGGRYGQMSAIVFTSRASVRPLPVGCVELQPTSLCKQMWLLSEKTSDRIYCIFSKIVLKIN